MGVSTDAILFYGYCWTEEDVAQPWKIRKAAGDEDEDKDEDTWEERYARAKGLPPSEQEDWKAVQKIAETSPCCVGTHCMDSCPMAYVAVDASLTISRRGFPEEITALTVDPAWKDQLAEFCRVMGIKIKDLKAAWWLVSHWSE